MISDSFTDYSHSYDLERYAIPIQEEFYKNKERVEDTRFDHAWRGNVDSTLDGWEPGTFQVLQSADIIDQDFSVTHLLIENLKKEFNLPPIGPGEHQYIFRQRPHRHPWPLITSEYGIKCQLNIPICGMAFYGGDDREDNITIWPECSDKEAMEDHYRFLEENNTQAKDWTSVPTYGPVHTVKSKLYLLNMETYWHGSHVPPDNPKETMNLCIAWSSHSYKEIKFLIDMSVKQRFELDPVSL